MTERHQGTEVLLVQPEYGEEGLKKILHHPGLEFPYNLTCLSSYLEKEGIRNEIFDWRLYDKPAELWQALLLKLKPLAVGITSTTYSLKNAGKIAKITKETES